MILFHFDHHVRVVLRDKSNSSKSVYESQLEGLSSAVKTKDIIFHGEYKDEAGNLVG